MASNFNSLNLLGSLNLLDDKGLVDMNFNKYNCTVCNLKLNSRDQYEEHVQGQKHISRERSAKISIDGRQVGDFEMNTSNLNNIRRRLSQVSLGISAEDDVISLPGGKGCTVCNIPNFTSPSHFKDHYGGKKHAAAVNRMDLKHIPLNCEECDAQFSGEISAKAHFDSDRHRKRIALRSDNSIPIIGTNCNTKWIHCNFCNVDLNSKEELDIHCDSPEHIKAKLYIESNVSSNGISTPRTEKQSSLIRRLFPNNTPETATQNPKDCEILNNLENSCNIRSSPGPSGNSGLKPNDTVPKNIQSLTDSDSVTMKKVPNPVKTNNNLTDITADALNNNLTISPSFPEKTTQPNSSANGNSITEENISNEDIGNIIDGIKSINITSPNGENKKISDCVSDDSNVGNKKIPKAPSATGRGSQQARTARSTSPLKTEEYEIPYLQNMNIEKIEKNGKILCYYCNLCDSQLTQGAVKNHVEGINHRHKMMTRPAPVRDLPPVIQTCEDATDEAFFLTNFMPRGYQVELFEKCHSTDSIIFLPTGTGKTLCACMLISYMLKLNPKRSVLFLLDKVLLVLQQKKFVEEQLHDKYLRFDLEDNDKLVERELNIACVFGGAIGTLDKPLWMHDVVVSTAAFCSNMMDKGVLRWSDFSFVVVDEAHHCVKSHPFKKIFEKRHSVLEKSKCPKVLGLTASPAGQETLEGTIQMLVSLSMNMGDAKIRIVENTVDELNKYKSNARLEIEMLPPSNEEMSFNFHMQEYLRLCLLKLTEKSDICNYIDFTTISEKNGLNAERLDDLMTTFEVLVIDKDKAAGTSLLWHIKKITSALAVSLEMGIPLAFEELKSLLDKDNKIDGFSKALELGLPCQTIKEMCEKYTMVMDDALWEQGEIMSTVHLLIKKITDLQDKEKKNSNAIVLVLVRQRTTAMRLSTIMNKSTAIKQRNLSCVSLIGHGAGTGTGMNVNDQKRTLEEIKNNKHRVIIATSVAEEGIDLPECSLVITMKPPTSITTLLQMRGRARKKNSLFLTICGNEKQKAKLENLLQQEEVMERATFRLVDYYKKCDSV